MTPRPMVWTRKKPRLTLAAIAYYVRQGYDLELMLRKYEYIS
jgi:hypothetical protein